MSELILRLVANTTYASCVDLLTGERFETRRKLVELIRADKVHLGFIADDHLRAANFSGRYMARLLHVRAAGLRQFAAELDRLAIEAKAMQFDSLPILSVVEGLADDGDVVAYE